MRLPRIGPGAVVTAAFIGPGTVTTCTLAGVRFHYALLWALVFATVGTIALQEMAARLGTIGRIGLGDAVRRRVRSPGLRLAAALLIAAAIGIGNAAYQTGNLLGAGLGAQAALGGEVRWWAAALGVGAAALLWLGSYRQIERVLVAMVVLMSLVFLATAVAVGAELPALLRGSLVPTMPAGASVVALGLVGTTIVPYNLFLHASAARERFGTDDATGTGGALRAARADLVVAIALGGLVSMAIVVTAAASGADQATTAAEMARQLEPLLGEWARVFFAAGLLAAGLTSAITAPMAAAYALAGVFGWPPDLRAPRLRLVWGTVIAVGIGFALAGVRPVPAILFAQAANGLLLPLVAAFLLWVMNDRALLGRATNGRLANAVGALVVGLTLVLGVRAVVGAVG